MGVNGSTNRPAIWAWCVVVTALSLSPFAASAQQAQPTHPLDALTGPELRQVKSILQAEGKLGPKTRFHNVDLDEPDKAAVTAWRPGASLPRRAIAVVSEAGTVHQAAIDLSAGRMTAWQAVTGEPALLLGEMIGAADMALAIRAWCRPWPSAVSRRSSILPPAHVREFGARKRRAGVS